MTLVEKIALAIERDLNKIPLHWRVALVVDVLMAYWSAILYGLAIQGAAVNPDGWLLPLGFAFWTTVISGGYRFYNYRKSLRQRVSIWD